MGEIEKKLTEALKSAEKGFKEDPKLKEFEKASNDFNKLVKEGLAVRRGHNLRSPGEMHLSPHRFNASES